MCLSRLKKLLSQPSTGRLKMTVEMIGKIYLWQSRPVIHEQKVQQSCKYVYTEWYIDHFAETYLILLCVGTYHTWGAGIAQSVQQWATGWMARVHFLVGEWDFLFSSVQTSFGPTQPPIQHIPVDSSQGGKVARAWSWPLTSIQCQDQEWWSYTSIPPHTSSWHINQLSTGATLSLPYHIL
jgi:hypothetical protein